MADVASTLRLWSGTAGSNSPSGGTVIGAGLDDNLREIQAVVRKYLASSGSDMSSGSTVDLATADGYYINITGTTTITALGTEAAGIHYLLKFAGALTFTHNGTSLILPTGANITTAAGDLALMVSEGSGNWRCAFYQRADGTPIVGAATQSQVNAMTNTTGYLNSNVNKIILGTEAASTSGTTVDYTSIPSGVRRINVMGAGVSTNGTSGLMVQIGDAGGIENTNYTGGVTTSNTATAFTTGFGLMETMVAGNTYDFKIVLDLENAAAFRWVASGVCIEAGAGQAARVSVGAKALSAVLDRVTITTVNGTDTFDAGVINISYER